MNSFSLGTNSHLEPGQRTCSYVSSSTGCHPKCRLWIILSPTVFAILIRIPRKMAGWKSNNNIFSALHGMPARTSNDWESCQSVCRSIKRVNCDKTEQKFVQIFIPYERSFSLVFWAEEWLVGGGNPFYLKFWSTGPRWSEIADFEPIIARRPSAVTPSEKKLQLILIGSSLSAF